MAKESKAESTEKPKAKAKAKPKRKLVRVLYEGPTAKLRVDGEVVEIGGVLTMDIDAADRLSGNPDVDVSILEGE